MNLLTQGLDILCKNDTDIEKLIAPRNEEVVRLLKLYINEIELFNPAYGLVGVENTEELIIKHILDSLTPVGIISYLLNTLPENNNKILQIADVGSGAGLPGIPLAIVLPHCNFTLIERMGRRAGFLQNTKAVLGLSNITIEENEIEKTTHGPFDMITFRAFKPLEPKLIRTLFNNCTPNGFIAAYKGKQGKIEAEIASVSVSNKHWEATPYTVPFLDEERHLVTGTNL